MSEAIDILILTALPVEFAAVLAAEVALEPWQVHRDSSSLPFHVRRMGRLRIAAAWTGEMGETAAASGAAALIDHLDPRCLAMCGICAGKRGDVHLGDVIVADRVYSYDHGKLVASADASGARVENFYHDIKTYNLDSGWRIDAQQFSLPPALLDEIQRIRPPSPVVQEAWIRHRLAAHEHGDAPSPIEDPERARRAPDWTKRLLALIEAGLVTIADGKLALTPDGMHLVLREQILYPDADLGSPADPPFRVHVGSIATGKAVRKDAELFGRLERHVRKTIGVEMEAAAIGHVAAQFHRKAIIVKGVVDYGDLQKDDTFHHFAARASAEVLLRFLAAHEASLTARGATRGAGPAQLEKVPNPFQTARPLRAEDPSYVVRPCDEALHAALERHALIAIEGEYGIGKSSLAERARATLSLTRAVLHADLAAAPAFDPFRLQTYLFKRFTAMLGRPIQEWTDLANGVPMALIIDEFGALTEKTAPAIVPALVYLATKAPGIRILVCVPSTASGATIGDLLGQMKISDEHIEPWHRIVVPRLDYRGVEHLLALLPSRARSLPKGWCATLRERADDHPMAVQRVCSSLHDAILDGQSDDVLMAIVRDKSRYQ